MIAAIPNHRGLMLWRPKIIGKQVASVPFKISISKTMVPAVLPNTRKVLVVPLLPLPN